ncbi:hypothetical protein [Streptomyces clavuligerus]|uniref:Uncharacterized protein n=2 Tax=Streptomyces clavuligerus TaxID=1901 RepID=Q6TMP4_STRCL|nr:hypothetical protein [Streptomyces clavuligerus]AAQ93579.1 hypothetical protein pSCL2.7.207.11 [Streptomyces clavuligerus]AXU16867.1 hypothetical protein D1794_29340 [Streptomyces clavuligerus]EDY48702.1 conserved hypothetical protein [Streptomyces clavuligerus]MBY6301003.1 hypothetical protein [Streptomyces clavuligerus]QPJ97078.1 hypothetical protein GE265_28140 [Streptomyces clavuligerus]
MLLSYVASLALPGPEAQLLAVVVAIRAARGGVGNVTGADLSALRLSDPRGAIGALRDLGWHVDDVLFDGDPTAAIPFTVPSLAQETGHPMPFGKNTRSRVSGWTTRALSAKPVRKLPPAARLAGLFLAAHSTSKLLGQIPPDLPEACRATLPDLLLKGFLTELSEDRCRLDPALRHLSGMRHPTEEEKAAEPPKAQATSAPTRTPGFDFDADAWTRWKNSTTPALRRHTEAVEHCPVCALPPEQVAQAFTAPGRPQSFSRSMKTAYGTWKDTHPDRGPLAAEFTVAFRSEHGHGPSYAQLCTGLGWELSRSLRGFVVKRLVVNEWLTESGHVPWTLRPGPAAQAQGIVLPKARGPEAAVPARP